jgi:hypothetical protein
MNESKAAADRLIWLNILRKPLETNTERITKKIKKNILVDLSN